MLQRLEASAQVQRDVNRVTDGGEDLEKSLHKYRKFIPEVHSTAKGYTPSDVRSCINFGVTTQYELYQHMHSMQEGSEKQYKTDTVSDASMSTFSQIKEMWLQDPYGTLKFDLADLSGNAHRQWVCE